MAYRQLLLKEAEAVRFGPQAFSQREAAAARMARMGSQEAAWNMIGELGATGVTAHAEAGGHVVDSWCSFRRKHCGLQKTRNNCVELYFRSPICTNNCFGFSEARTA